MSKSFGWSLFTLKEYNEHLAVCNLCKKVISKGPPNKPREYSTTPLHKDAEKSHAEEYKSAKPGQFTGKQLLDHLNQPTIQQSSESAKLWNVNDEEAMEIHRKIVRACPICMNMPSFEIPAKAPKSSPEYCMAEISGNRVSYSQNQDSQKLLFLHHNLKQAGNGISRRHI